MKAMPERKRIYFDFFQCVPIAAQAHLPPVGMDALFASLMDDHNGADTDTVRNIGGRSYELRRIERRQYGYRGVIGKYRLSNLPHAAVPGGEERELDLREDEGLLEKSYFKYFTENSVLVLQRNRNSINHDRFSRYLSVNGYTVALDPIIEPTDIRRLLNGEVSLRSMDIRVAKPTNPELFEGVQHDFNNSLIQGLNASRATVMNLNVRGDGHSRVPEQRFLAADIKRAFVEMKRCFDLQKAQLVVEEDGIDHPIDLVTDRVVHNTVMEFEGRYPLPNDMWAALMEAKQEKDAELTNYFGALNGERLV